MTLSTGWNGGLAVGILIGVLGWVTIGCGGDGTGTSTTPACAPNETRTCVCAEGGLMGAQTCNATGSGYSTCGPCTAARCGDGTCNAMETCSSCAADCGTCMARCGDATCNGTETCSSCAADCGACVATPRCGDGTCNGSETCSTCSDDCGVCAPRCGDGSCNGSETCTTCGADCGVCETMCMACAQDVDCPSGFRCGQRRCDGARSCYSATVTSCAVVGGVRCPPTSAYNLCTSDAAAMPSECGAFAVCMAYGDGRRFCSRRCTTNLDCPTPPTGSTTVPVCDTNTSRCYLRCDAPGACPYGLSCFRYANGTYGYCS